MTSAHATVKHLIDGGFAAVPISALLHIASWSDAAAAATALYFGSQFLWFIYQRVSGWRRHK